MNGSGGGEHTVDASEYLMFVAAAAVVFDGPAPAMVFPVDCLYATGAEVVFSLVTASAFLLGGILI